MIDLHCHILPGLDDGAPSTAASISIARMAAADGVETIVGTPHVREDFVFPLDQIAERSRTVNEQLEQRGIQLHVRPGAEVAVSKLDELDDETLGRLSLGDGGYVLVESPYLRATDLFETSIFALQVRGFRVVLAHPERSPSFMTDPDRLAALVARGVLCSVTAASMAGRFGRTVQRFSARMFELGLVHNVASDAHDTEKRPPGLRAGFRLLDRDLPGLGDQRDWFTRDAPAAILKGEPLPRRPAAPRGRKRPWTRRKA